MNRSSEGGVVTNSSSIQKRKDTMSVQETADYLGVHRDTVYNMVRRKQIPHFKIRSRIFFSKTTIDTWISKQEELIDASCS